ncbi:MAG TPA: hypothetical protein VKJ65_09430, partial [Phycisphaerae bacterium]|nr:hypothetical protein [Phycisphaerae bacterium]
EISLDAAKIFFSSQTRRHFFSISPGLKTAILAAVSENHLKRQRISNEARAYKPVFTKHFAPRAANKMSILLQACPWGIRTERFRLLPRTIAIQTTFADTVHGCTS